MTASAYYGGLGPGLLATVLSIPLLDYFYLAEIRAVDFGPPVYVSLAVFVAVALAVNSLHLLYILEDPVSNLGLADGYEMPPDFLKQVERSARDRIQKLLTDVERANYEVKPSVREGSPFVEIVRYAREQHIDLIVMGTHGRGPIAHMLLGSVAEQVLRKAPCPVLVVRRPEHEFVMP